MRPERSRDLTAAGVALAGAAGLGAVGATALPLAGAFAGLLALCLLLLNTAWSIPLLIAASALDRVAISAGGAQVRVDMIVSVFLAVILFNRVLIRSLPAARLFSPITWPLLGYLLFNVFSTVLFSTERARGLKLDLEILAAALTFTVVYALLPSRDAVDRAVRVLWLLTVAEAAVGLLCLIAYIGHVSSFGVQQGDFGLPMVYGTQYEANIFGSFLLGNFFILLADYMRRPRSALLGVGLLLVLAGVVASMTRTVWLGLLLGLLLFAVCSLRLRGQARILLPVMVSVPVVAILGLVLGSATPFAGRLFDLINLHSSSAFGRIVIFNAALSDWRHHLLFGSGTGSFNFGAIPGQPHPWLPSLFLLTLHDTGIAGMAILTALLILFYRTMLRALGARGDMAFLAAGATAGFSALLFAFQTTTGFWFAYPWIVAGIGVAAARLADGESGSSHGNEGEETV